MAKDHKYRFKEQLGREKTNQTKPTSVKNKPYLGRMDGGMAKRLQRKGSHSNVSRFINIVLFPSSTLQLDSYVIMVSPLGCYLPHTTPKNSIESVNLANGDRTSSIRD